jgi:hypothetical protein
LKSAFDSSFINKLNGVSFVSTPAPTGIEGGFSLSDDNRILQNGEDTKLHILDQQVYLTMSDSTGPGHPVATISDNAIRFYSDELTQKSIPELVTQLDGATIRGNVIILLTLAEISGTFNIRVEGSFIIKYHRIYYGDSYTNLYLSRYNVTGTRWGITQDINWLPDKPVGMVDNGEISFNTGIGMTKYMIALKKYTLDMKSEIFYPKD